MNLVHSAELLWFLFCVPVQHFSFFSIYHAASDLVFQCPSCNQWRI